MMKKLIPFVMLGFVAVFAQVDAAQACGCQASKSGCVKGKCVCAKGNTNHDGGAASCAGKKGKPGDLHNPRG